MRADGCCDAAPYGGVEKRLGDPRVQQVPFHMRIGIHTGYCNVGNFGSREQRMDYTSIIGGAVNLAARLQQAGEADGIPLEPQDPTRWCGRVRSAGACTLCWSRVSRGRSAVARCKASWPTQLQIPLFHRKAQPARPATPVSTSGLRGRRATRRYVRCRIALATPQEAGIVSRSTALGIGRRCSLSMTRRSNLAPVSSPLKDLYGQGRRERREGPRIVSGPHAPDVILLDIMMPEMTVTRSRKRFASGRRRATFR